MLCLGVGRYARTVGGGVRVDGAGAVEIAEAAAEFAWTWGWRDIVDFAAQRGWERVSETGGSALELLTGIGVAQPTAQAFGDADRVDGVIITVADTDDVERDARPSLAAAFHEVSAGLWSRWRDPTGTRVATNSDRAGPFRRLSSD